jgi:hypothetical protein
LIIYLKLTRVAIIDLNVSQEFAFRRLSFSVFIFNIAIRVRILLHIKVGTPGGSKMQAKGIYGIYMYVYIYIPCIYTTTYILYIYGIYSI